MGGAGVALAAGTCSLTNAVIFFAMLDGTSLKHVVMAAAIHALPPTENGSLEGRGAYLDPFLPHLSSFST